MTEKGYNGGIKKLVQYFRCLVCKFITCVVQARIQEFSSGGGGPTF